MGTKKNPAKSSISHIFRTVEELRVQLQDFERMREETRTTIESVVKLIPSLEDERSRLQEDLELIKEKIARADCSIRDLENEERKIQEDIRLDQDRISHIDGQMRALSRMMNLEV